MMDPPELRPIRQKARAKLAAALGDSSDPTLAEHVEISAFNYTLAACKARGVSRRWEEPRFRDAYSHKILSLEFNLKNPKNPRLLERVTSGEMGPKKLVSAMPYDTFPEIWEVFYERAAERQLRRMLCNDAAGAPDGMFQCSKCKSRKTTYTLLQTRSADEPATVFYVCLSCGKRWKG